MRERMERAQLEYLHQCMGDWRDEMSVKGIWVAVDLMGQWIRELESGIEALDQPGAKCAWCGEREECMPGSNDCLECPREELVRVLVGDDQVWSPSTETWHDVLYIGQIGDTDEWGVILRKSDGSQAPKLKFPGGMTFTVKPGKTRRAIAALAGMVESTKEDDAR